MIEPPPNPTTKSQASSRDYPISYAFRRPSCRSECHLSIKPRIAFVGQLDSGRGASRSEQRFEALRELGFEVEGILSSRSGAPRPTLSTRLRARIGIPSDIALANQRLLSLAERRPFDVLWLDKALTIWPWTVWRLKQRIHHLIIGAWIEEHVGSRLNRSEFLGGVLPLCDYGFTPRCQNLANSWLKKRSPRQLVLVDDTYDPRTHLPWLDEEGRPPPLTTDVGFVGTFERERAEDLLFLACRGIRVSIWGSNWHLMRKRHPNLDIKDRPITGDDYARTLSSTRINLCFLRKANQDRQTNRTMEIPACGGFMLAERTPEHMRLFAEGAEADFFSSREELLAKVRYYLANEDKRTRIASAGHERVVQAGHSHHERLAYMLDVMLATARNGQGSRYRVQIQPGRKMITRTDGVTVQVDRESRM